MMIKRKLGFSRTRAFYSGAAKLHHETADYMSKLGIKIAELYGLTETMGLSLYNEARAPVRGSVGRAFPGVDLRLAEDGEICLRAPYHFLGYFKKPEMTAEVLREGWFYTGDIGEKSPEGFVKITDRKKDIFKTASGKYVAPLPIETLLKAHPAIKEVMVVGENKPHCVALACVESTLAQTEELLAHLEKVNAHLAIHEKIKTIGCMTRMWSVDQGELTPTLKLKRKQILKHYGDVIEELFETRSPIQMLDDDEKRKKAQC
jgi:long-chain acyl-CoA synthetase